MIPEVVDAADGCAVDGGVALGEIVATGAKKGERCDFGSLDVGLAAGGLVTNWAVIRINDSCEVAVVARWHGSLGDRPADILPGVDDLAATVESFTETADLGQGEALTTARSPVSLSSSSCSTHKQQIIHYGYGGPLDVLTKHIGEMVACEDATGFTSVSHTGTCVATDPPGWWEWVIER